MFLFGKEDHNDNPSQCCLEEVKGVVEIKVLCKLQTSDPLAEPLLLYPQEAPAHLEQKPFLQGSGCGQRAGKAEVAQVRCGHIQGGSTSELWLGAPGIHGTS